MTDTTDTQAGTIDPAAVGLPAAPDVKPNTKFRRGGFKSSAEAIAEAEAAGKQTADAGDPDINAAIAADPNIGFENPEGVTFAAPVSHTTEEEAVAEAPAEELPKTAAPKIKIGGREFTNQEEAWAYAEELQRQADAADAFRQGIEAAQKAPAGNPAPPPPVEQEIDLDPLDPDFKQKLSKWKASVIQEAKAAVKQDTNLTAMWDGFYRDNPDLAHVKDYVQVVMDQEKATLFPMDIQPALKLLAEKTRAKLKPYAEASLPKIALPKVPAVTAPTGAAPVTQKTQAPKPLNFAEQLKQNKQKKGAAQVR